MLKLTKAQFKAKKYAFSPFVEGNHPKRDATPLKTAQHRSHRFANAIGVHALALTIEDASGNKCDIREIAVDGIYLPLPRVQRYGRSLVVAGGRVDWLVLCDRAGSYSVGINSFGQRQIN